MTGPKGTPIYAGPEVYLMDIESFTEKCDVWGGGLILYEMLTQEMLFKHVKVIYWDMKDIPATKIRMGKLSKRSQKSQVQWNLASFMGLFYKHHAHFWR